MKKNKRVLLHNPYLDVIGGGEKHILSICKVLEDEGYNIDIMWDLDLSKEIKEKLHIEFKTLRFIPKKLGHHDIIFKKLWFLKDYDILLYVTDGGYFFSSAKKNFIFSMYPKAELYSPTPLKKLKWLNFSFISNSVFTQKHLTRLGITSKPIEPFIDDVFLKTDITLPRKKVILTVGRFFKQLHAKRQDKAIEAFQQLQKNDTEFAQYSLVLAGNVKDESDKEYFKELQTLAGNSKNIIFKPNIPFNELLELYRTSAYYWHFAGYGVDEEKNPERVEHFGIAPLEAMASGSIPFCYKAGGPAEVIKNDETGYLFTSNEELFSELKKIEKDTKKKVQLRVVGQTYVKNNFSYESFKKKVINNLLK